MKLCKRRGLPMDELWTVVGKLLNGEQLEEKYQAHILAGDRKGQWECHIQPNWLLVWEIRNQELILVLLNTGTHSDLFGKNRRLQHLRAPDGEVSGEMSGEVFSEHPTIQTPHKQRLPSHFGEVLDLFHTTNRRFHKILP